MTDELVTRLRNLGINLADRAADRIEAAEARVKQLEQLDSEAATYVESVIALRTHFTGEPPYVGWKGLGLALNEALDARKAAEAKVAALVELLTEAKLMVNYATLAGKLWHDATDAALRAIGEGKA